MRRKDQRLVAFACLADAGSCGSLGGELPLKMLGPRVCLLDIASQESGFHPGLGNEGLHFAVIVKGAPQG